MKLPTTGRVVVIDDDFSEALPLIQVLSQSGIAVQYFNGEPETLPENPIEGVRVVFLDIELGTAGQDNKSKISKVVGILGRVLGHTQFPYIIIAWTKHAELISEIAKGLATTPPLKILDMQKIDCKDSEGNYTLDQISARLNQTLQNIGSLQAFLIWEELVHKAANATVNEAFLLTASEADWDDRMQNILFNLAKANEGAQLKDNEVLHSAMKAFNGIYFDIIEKQLSDSPLLANNAGIPFTNKTKLSPELIADLNTRLLCPTINSNEVVPGNIYLTDYNKIDVNLVITSYQNVSAEWTPEYVLLETTPSCDYAQDKWKVSRLLPGVLVPQEYGNKIKRSADFVFMSKLLKINGTIGWLVFDLRDFGTLPLEQVRTYNASYRIRQSMLVDIQSKMANHIARPGYFALD